MGLMLLKNKFHLYYFWTNEHVKSLTLFLAERRVKVGVSNEHVSVFFKISLA